MDSHINTISFKTSNFWLTQLLSSLKGLINMHKKDPSYITHVTFQETFNKATHQNPSETNESWCKGECLGIDKWLEDVKQSKLTAPAMVEDDQWNSQGFVLGSVAFNLSKNTENGQQQWYGRMYWFHYNIQSTTDEGWMKSRRRIVVS